MKKRRFGHHEQDFELNLASIIDCFTVLIAFVMISASFVSVGFLDADVEAAGHEQAMDPAPAFRLTLTVREDHAVALELSGKAQQSQTVAAAAGHEDFASLSKHLESLHSRYPELKGATVIAAENVAYQDVIQTLETTRKTLPGVSLGGF